MQWLCTHVDERIRHTHLHTHSHTHTHTHTHLHSDTHTHTLTHSLKHTHALVCHEVNMAKLLLVLAQPGTSWLSDILCVYCRDEEAPELIPDPAAQRPDGWLGEEEPFIPDPMARPPDDWWVTQMGCQPHISSWDLHCRVICLSQLPARTVCVAEWPCEQVCFSS